MLKATEIGIQERIQAAITTSIDTINRRINALGTAELTVVQQGKDRILIQYPGLTDIQRLKDLVNKTAKLSFHEVHPQMSAEQAEADRASAWL